MLFFKNKMLNIVVYVCYFNYWGIGRLLVIVKILELGYFGKKDVLKCVYILSKVLNMYDLIFLREIKVTEFKVWILCYMWR